MDTNGTNPALLKDLIDNKLLDYVAMDFKAPFQKDSQICGSNASLVLEEIKESIKILLTGQVAYEFRTTFNPELKKEDILEMAEYIQGARLYVLQQYRKPDLPDYEKLALRLQQDVYKLILLKKQYKSVEIVAVCQEGYDQNNKKEAVSPQCTELLIIVSLFHNNLPVISSGNLSSWGSGLTTIGCPTNIKTGRSLILSA